MSDKTLLMRKKNNQSAHLSLSIEEQNSLFEVLQGSYSYQVKILDTSS